MLHQEDKGPGTTSDDNLDIPPFLKREPGQDWSWPTPKRQELPMRDDDKAAAAADTEASAPAEKPVKAPKATKVAKPRKGANGAATDKAAKAAPKAAKTAKGTAKAAKAAKVAKPAKAQRQRDPAKLDTFGFRKDSIKSRAAAMYAKGKGATLAEVKEEVGSVQFNLLTELGGRGFQIDQTEVKNAAGRMVTRYKLHQQAA